MPSSDARLLPFLVGGATVSLLGWSLVLLMPIHGSGMSRLLGLVVGAVLLVISCAVAVTAPSRPNAWRRLLALAAVLSFVIAGVVWVAPPMVASPETMQGARAENAPGLALFILLAVLGVAILASPAFIALGLLLALLAWLLGREPKLRRMVRREKA